ncbi:MAG: Na+/H+ antiporter subunit E [Aquincola sp.]|nr:Na+/H+ antiporter subunit E [Aquincola sp.]MDH4288534.1 Na+/H+ antiporter subunit E [Aquincola sp.]MDH5329780.1 Na+/H+ antiporter subunit E [Aquincola sp.]
MRTLFPAPLLSLALFVAWLMLNESASVGHLLLGAGFGVALPWFTRGMREEVPHVRRAGTALALAAVVLADIVRSNVTVARLILGSEHHITPRFVWVPLAIRDPHGIVALATIVTMTPGTLSADITDDRRHLLVHAFDVDDEAAHAALVDDIKARYEAPLIRIFEGNRA